MKKTNSKQSKKTTSKNKKSSAMDSSTKFLLASIGIFALVILGVLFAGKLFPKEKQVSVKYNNFEFNKREGMWHVDLRNRVTDQVFDIPLRYSPYEVDEVEVQGNPSDFLMLKEKYGLNAVYLTFDPEDTNLTTIALGSSELSINLAQVLNIKPIAACANNETEACSKRPIVDCEDDDRLVIYLKGARENETPKVIEDTNCITLTGHNLDLLKSVDRMLYLWYGIMKH